MKTRLKTSQVFPVLFALLLSSSLLVSSQVKPVQAETQTIKHSVTVVWDFDNATVQNWFCTKVGGGNETILESTHHYSGSYSIHNTAVTSGASANLWFGLGQWGYAAGANIPQTIWTFPSNVIGANLTYWSEATYAFDANTKAVGMKLAYANSTFIFDDLNTGLAINYGVWVQSEVWNITPYLDFDNPTQIRIKVGSCGRWGGSNWASDSTIQYDSIMLKYDYNEITTINVLLEQIQGLLPIFLGIGVAGFLIVLTRRRQG